MTPLTDLPMSARTALNAFAMTYGQHLPATTSQPGLTGSPSGALASALSALSIFDMTVQAIEALYAFNADIADAPSKAAAQELCAQLCFATTQLAWNAFADPTRPNKIMWAMMRDAGETAPAGTAWPAQAADPPVASQFGGATAPPAATSSTTSTSGLAATPVAPPSSSTTASGTSSPSSNA